MSDDKLLIVSEIFFSLEGETSFVGLPMVFVRLAGCNLACNWCDTEHARIAGENDLKLSVADIIGRINEYSTKYVCLTGGEPLLQPGSIELAEKIVHGGSTLLVETNGTLPIKDLPRQARIILDVKCPSSGEHAKDCEDNFSIIDFKDEVKFIIADRQDYEYAIDFCQNRSLFDVTNISFGPAFGKLPQKTLAEWIISDALVVRYNAGLHRTIWGPKTRGR
jgi:7-carboxy-7-deazaguanine synthase